MYRIDLDLEMEMDHPEKHIFTRDEIMGTGSWGLSVDWSTMEELNKRDIAEGRPETPRNMKHIFGRYDAAGWNEAALTSTYMFTNYLHSTGSTQVRFLPMQRPATQPPMSP